MAWFESKFYLKTTCNGLNRVIKYILRDCNKICDEAKGGRRFVGEFSQSMSDFKPGGCNTTL